MRRSAFTGFLDASWPVGKLFDIPIRLHITLLFFLFPAFRMAPGMGPLFAAELVILLILSVLLHELGHALMAKHYRLRGLSIMLHGFGGFAMSTGHRTPKQSLSITLAGPAVTFAIGIACYLIGKFGAGSAPGPTDMQLVIIYSIGLINLWMGVMNLIPTLPFDGGMALVAILNMRHSEFKAQRIVEHGRRSLCRASRRSTKTQRRSRLPRQKRSPKPRVSRQRLRPAKGTRGARATAKALRGFEQGLAQINEGFPLRSWAISTVEPVAIPLRACFARRSIPLVACHPPQGHARNNPDVSGAIVVKPERKITSARLFLKSIRTFCPRMPNPNGGYALRRSDLASRDFTGEVDRRRAPRISRPQPRAIQNRLDPGPAVRSH
ncbi:MAG: M50 family metallopeptidase, partial [Fimbriimonadaceae bacterium]